MTTVPPNIIGPIDSGNSFTIVGIVDDTPCTLLLSANKTYYWQSDFSKVANVPVFYATGEPPNLTIRDTINSGGLSLNNFLLVNVLNPQPITVSEDSFALWSPPAVLLSKVPYTLSYQGVTGSIPLGDGGKNVLATDVYFVSTTSYYNCVNKAVSVTDPLKSTANWICQANPNVNVNVCDQYTLINNGWTNFPDCAVGVQYEYCPVDYLCGSSSCNGPCSEIYDDCIYNSGSYACIFDIEKYFKDVPWYQNYILIVFAVGIVIFLILLGLVLIRWHNNSLELARQRAQQARRRARYQY